MLIPILYRDDTIVVVDKPLGMPSSGPRPGAGVAGAAASAPGLPGAGGIEDPCPGDVLAAVKAQLGLDYLGGPQREDAETSGVLLFASQREANAALAVAFGTRAVERVYLALVHGAPRKASGAIDAPLSRGQGDQHRVTTPRDKRGQRAVTHYRVLETSPGGRYSLLEVTPEAGAGHQVRAHLAHTGLPVVGDALYKAAEPEVVVAKASATAKTPAGARTVTGSAASSSMAGVRAQPRLALHLHRLTLRHPVLGQTMTFTSPPPALFNRLASGLPELDLAAIRHVRDLKRVAAGRAAGLAELLELALARRAPLAAEPGTTIFRLINGAGDGFAGLTVDRYGDALVASVYDEVGRPDPLPPVLIERLSEVTAAAAIYVKYRQRQASRVEEAELPALAPSRPVAGGAGAAGSAAGGGEIRALENGLAYLVRPGEGWNPGLFPDMREMRARVAAWARGKRVLNCFAYTCGFGLAAFAGGASRVANLDVSWPSLERGRANYRANGFAPRTDDFLYGDVFDWLPRLAQRRELFDIVILDPPGFARTKTHTWKASHNYGKLVQAAAPVIEAGGLLVACCNVADFSWESFRNRVQAGLDEAWRAAEVVGEYQAPSLDFPPARDRESYLKILVARLK